MAAEPITLVIMLIVFVTTLSQSTFGFGNALLAMPLLSLFLEVPVVLPLVALLAFTVSLSIVIRDRQHVRLRSNWYLIGFSILGVPLGFYWVTYAPELVVKLLLGVLVMGFALFGLNAPRRQNLTDERWAGWFGFTSGLLGGAYNTYGPPLVIYGTLRNWSQEHFRATLQGCFLPISGFAMFLHWYQGWWTIELLQMYLLCLPPTLAGIILGRLFNTSFPRNTFIRYVYALLFLSGAVLVTQVAIRTFS